MIELAKGGRVVTFSEFDVDPGAGDLRVYLHEGKSDSDDLGDFVEIAKLKGNKGDQQYEIPAEVDLERYNSVVIWCVPFSTRIAQAPLMIRLHSPHDGRAHPGARIARCLLPGARSRMPRCPAGCGLPHPTAW